VSAQSTFALDNLAVRIMKQVEDLDVLAIRISSPSAEERWTSGFNCTNLPVAVSLKLRLSRHNTGFRNPRGPLAHELIADPIGTLGNRLLRSGASRDGEITLMDTTRRDKWKWGTHLASRSCRSWFFSAISDPIRHCVTSPWAPWRVSSSF